MQSILLNNYERVVVGQFKATRPVGAPGGTVDPAGALLPGEQLMIYPGINVIPTDKLTKLRAESATFNQMFVDKIEREKSQEGPSYERIGKPKLELLVEKDVDPKLPFAKIKDPALMTRIIRDTFNENLLKLWVNSAGNEGIRAELYKQLEFIKTGVRESE